MHAPGYMLVSPGLHGSSGFQAKESRSTQPSILGGGRARALEERRGAALKVKQGGRQPSSSQQLRIAVRKAREGSRKRAVACAQDFISSLENLLFALKEKKPLSLPGIRGND